MIEPEKPSKTISPPRTLTGLIGFLFRRIVASRKWWLLPLWIFLVALALILFLTGTGALLPAIYIAF
ncbi:hypothetical protein BH10BDE1_BH10BDE1_29950 [soil metagenome]